MKIKIILAFFFTLSIFYGYSQSVGISDDGSAPYTNAILDLKSSNKGFLPPRVDLNDVNTPAPLSAVTAGMIIYNEGGSEPHGLYLWTNNKWTKLSRQGGGPLHYIGELYGGGIVFFVWGANNQHGLIASLENLDNGSGVQFIASLGLSIPNNYYDGSVNTAAAVAYDNTPGYAVTLCDSYSAGGYNDWYLPSHSELALLRDAEYRIREVLGADGDPNTNGLLGQDNSYTGEYKFWTSSYFAGDDFHFLYTNTGYMDNRATTEYLRVRAIRSF